MPRNKFWVREVLEQETYVTEFWLSPTSFGLGLGDTLIRLRWHYQLLGRAPSGTVLDQLKPAALGVVVLNEARVPPSEPSFGPIQDPTASDGVPWLWWEMPTYYHWNPVATDDRWAAPIGDPKRDTEAQRTGTATPDPTDVLWWWYQQEDGIDWEVRATISLSALIETA